MNKNDIFEFTAPNGVEVTAVALWEVSTMEEEYVDEGVWGIATTWLCYAQNRLFTLIETCHQYEVGYEEIATSISKEYGENIVNYAILPDYDSLLEDYQHQLDMADDYASREC